MCLHIFETWRFVKVINVKKFNFIFFLNLQPKCVKISSFQFTYCLKLVSKVLSMPAGVRNAVCLKTISKPAAKIKGQGRSRGLFRVLVL